MRHRVFSEKVLILIILENWARECESKGKIAIELSKKVGLPVYLIPKNLANLIMPDLTGLYFHKSLQKHINTEVGKLISRGGRYAVIDDEVIIRDIKLDHRYGLNPGFCSVIFANSREEHDDLIRRGFSNVHLTGNPRLLPYGNRAKDQTEIKPLESLLFSSNFSMVRPAGTTSVARVVDDLGLDAAASNKLQRFIDLHISRELKIRNYLIKLSKDYKVTYRAHPIECFQSAIDTFKGTNVSVVKGGSITNDIESHDLVLHAGCSVALDAQLVGKKSIWLYASPDEAAGERSSLSHVFETTPNDEQLHKLFTPEKNKSDPETLAKMMTGASHLTRETSTSLIVKALSSEVDSMKKLSITSVLLRLPKIVFSYLLWMYRFKTDPIERERFDKKSISELIQFCDENMIKHKKLPGGILKVGSM